MKKYLIILFLVIAGVINVSAQSARLSIQKNVQAGDTLKISLIAENIYNVGAISLKILYDNENLEYSGLENGAVDFLSNSTDSIITIGWFDQTAKNPVNFGHDRMLDLVFIKKNSNGKIRFIEEDCEISNSSGKPIAVDYVDGME